MNEPAAKTLLMQAAVQDMPTVTTPDGWSVGKVALGPDRIISPAEQELILRQRDRALSGVYDPLITKKATDTQVGGSHYKEMVIQPVDFIHANKLGFFEGNIIKYICRFRSKHGKEDLLKARHYIDLLLEKEYGAGK